MSPTKAKNSFGIPFLRTGPRGLVAVLNQIIAALDAVRVVQGGEVTPGGTVITPATPSTRRDPISYPWPFRVTVNEDPDDADQWLISVNDGFVNGVLVTIGGDPLYASPAPTLPLAKGTSANLYLEVVPDSSFWPVTVELYLGSVPANVLDFATPENSRFRFSLAFITTAGVAIPAVGNNLAYTITSVGPAWTGV